MTVLNLAAFERETLRVASDTEVAHRRRASRDKMSAPEKPTSAGLSTAPLVSDASDDCPDDCQSGSQLNKTEKLRSSEGVGRDERGTLIVTEAEARALEAINATQRGFCVRDGRKLSLAMHCGLVFLTRENGAASNATGIGSTGVTLEILPKLWGGVGSEREGASTLAGTGTTHERRREIGRARQALLHLLRGSEELRLRTLDVAPQDAERAPLLDLFIRSFLREALRVAKGGLLTRYIETTSDMPLLRGRPLLVDSERLALRRPNLWRCSHDDLSVDNPYNRALFAAVERCRTHLRRRTTERLWLEVRAFFGEVSCIQMGAEYIDRLTRGRESARYDEALRWARLLLGLLSPSLAGGVSPAPALLFNMQDIFERWVARRERDQAPDGMIVAFKGSTRNLAKVGRGGASAGGPSIPLREVFQQRPDLLIWPPGVSPSHGSPEAIIDAKWKVLKPTRLDWGVDEDDARQVLVYLMRYGCQRAKLAYPVLSGSQLPADGPPTFWIDTATGTVSIEVALVPIDV
ncbi:hypothetical protein VSR34_27755 [Paraburkholderia sp. JHI2823]|uniref:McrC family protein n=1 Tax=Paraburkholderia sp. JHI2823 TaxID=3112960 RepID=UPI003170B191